MISCRDLTRRFGDFTGVDRLTLEVARGTICAFLGPNGAGKSTTIRMLSGLLAPTSGEAKVCGLNVANDSLAIRRKIGVLPENLGLFDDLTVEEHLLLTGQIYGLPGRHPHADRTASASAEPGTRARHVREQVFSRNAEEDGFWNGAAAQSGGAVARRAVRSH